MEKLPVSVIVVTFQEETHLRDCLESVGWASEVIVVDGGSTDKTQAIARNCGARLFIEANGPAEVQRLKGLKRISMPWFLLLDADERVSIPLRDSIGSVVNKPNACNAYRLLRRNYLGAKPIHFQHPDFHIRLFKSSEMGSLPEKIHRRPLPSGPTGVLKGELKHLFFTTWDDRKKKVEFYTNLEAQYWVESGKKLAGFEAFQRFWLRPIGRFLQFYLFKKGIWDGWFGLRYSWEGACYEWAVAQKVLDAQARASKPVGCQSR